MKYSSDLKENKIWKITKNIAYNFVLSIFFTLLLSVIAIKVFDIRLDVVLSDSMYPTFTKRDVVVVLKQDEYKVGDIIEYRKGDILVTHRIVEINEETNKYITKGDNSQSKDNEDGIVKSQINGKVIGHWENGRLIYNTLHNSYFVILAIIVGAWVLSTTISGEMEIRKHDILKG